MGPLSLWRPVVPFPHWNPMSKYSELLETKCLVKKARGHPPPDAGLRQPEHVLDETRIQIEASSRLRLRGLDLSVFDAEFAVWACPQASEFIVALHARRATADGLEGRARFLRGMFRLQDGAGMAAQVTSGSPTPGEGAPFGEDLPSHGLQRITDRFKSAEVALREADFVHILLRKECEKPDTQQPQQQLHEQERLRQQHGNQQQNWEHLKQISMSVVGLEGLPGQHLEFDEAQLNAAAISRSRRSKSRAPTCDSSNNSSDISPAVVAAARAAAEAIASAAVKETASPPDAATAALAGATEAAAGAAFARVYAIQERRGAWLLPGCLTLPQQLLLSDEVCCSLLRPPAVCNLCQHQQQRPSQVQGSYNASIPRGGCSSESRESGCAAAEGVALTLSTELRKCSRMPALKQLSGDPRTLPLTSNGSISSTWRQWQLHQSEVGATAAEQEAMAEQRLLLHYLPPPRELRWSSIGSQVYDWGRRAYYTDPSEKQLSSDSLARLNDAQSCCRDSITSSSSSNSSSGVVLPAVLHYLAGYALNTVHLQRQQTVASSSTPDAPAASTAAAVELAAYLQTALVNVYRAGDRLRGHKDDAEVNGLVPLVSIREEPLPLVLRSGDLLILSGPARLLLHGVPKLLYYTPKPPKLATRCEKCTDGGGGDGWKPLQSSCNNVDSSKIITSPHTFARHANGLRRGQQLSPPPELLLFGKRFADDQPEPKQQQITQLVEYVKCLPHLLRVEVILREIIREKEKRIEYWQQRLLSVYRELQHLRLNLSCRGT
ncbi:uncharacterized protein LOC34619983 [Cyclospora cayetanensis]|uniref:Uncharacterized protein LOC34619983 n=1 Tax=Cyclospora cayetanensis TaxID=88456 RepID=A0A6P6RXC6_9EIME|nr:uncharacterized protein LOC34619983 [Cyclospora cayetanensis]